MLDYSDWITRLNRAMTLKNDFLEMPLKDTPKNCLSSVGEKNLIINQIT